MLVHPNESIGNFNEFSYKEYDKKCESINDRNAKEKNWFEKLKLYNSILCVCEMWKKC